MRVSPQPVMCSSACAGSGEGSSPLSLMWSGGGMGIQLVDAVIILCGFDSESSYCLGGMVRAVLAP